MGPVAGGQAPQTAPVYPMPPGWTPEQWRVYGAQYVAQQQAKPAAPVPGQPLSGVVQLSVPSAPLPQQQQLLPGVVVSSGEDNKCPMVSLIAAEKQGKCLRGNTQLVDPKTGRLTSIEDVVRRLKNDSRVLTMNVASLLVQTTPVTFFENPAEQLFKLRTQSGFEIEATATHPFLTPSGWKVLKDLDLKTDRVATIAEYPAEIFWRGNDRSEAELKVLAYLLADGGIIDSIRFTKNEDEVRSEFVEAVEELGDSCRVDTRTDKHAFTINVSGGTVRYLLRGAGLEGKASAEKFIPSSVFGLRRGPTALFLSRLFTCDGSVEASGKLSFSSTSLQLVQQVRHLLARFGIVATTRDKYLDDQLYGRELMIQSRANVIRFIDEIGFFGEKQVKAEALRKRLAVPASGHAGDETQLWRHGPYLFDRIKSVEPTVVESTFDIEIADSHNFVANDFVVHNSTTAITSLVNYPEQGLEPLVLAFDSYGPDACVKVGYKPHVIRVRDQHGSSTMDRARGALAMLQQNIAFVHRRYGSIVVDCTSTAVMQLHDDAKRLPKNINNPDTRAPYFELGLYFKELINKVRDLGLPSVWLAWLQEGSTMSGGKDAAARTELGGPDIMGRKLRNFLAGTAHHNFVLEKYKVGPGGKDPWGGPADDENCVRVIHTKPWGLINAGGRYSHILPDPAPANLGWIFSAITGRGVRR